MTKDEFLDNEKSRGFTIYMCLDCNFRGYGASTTYHEINHPDHKVVKEDKLIIPLDNNNYDKSTKN